MSTRSTISVPLSVLAGAIYAPVGDRAGSSRPTGSGLTGSDLQLWWALLDLLRRGDDNGRITVLQTDLNAVLGRLHPDRLEAALERLRGTDAMISPSVMPCLVAWSRHGTGREPRTLQITFNSKVVDLVKGDAAQVRVDAIRQLSSRYSLVLYGRLVAWRKRAYPGDGAIKFGAHPAERAFQLDVPGALLGGVFGFYGAMRPSDVERLLSTARSTCPLRRELGKASVAVDTVMLRDEISPSRFSGLRIRISEVLADGMPDIIAADRHRKLRSTHSKRLYEQQKA